MGHSSNPPLNERKHHPLSELIRKWKTIFLTPEPLFREAGHTCIFRWTTCGEKFVKFEDPYKILTKRLKVAKLLLCQVSSSKLQIINLFLIYFCTLSSPSEGERRKISPKIGKKF